MQFMRMMLQKDIKEFREAVIYRQKLKAVNIVLGILIKVQKNWQRLEIIFLASENIKTPLSEDTKRSVEINNT